VREVYERCRKIIHFYRKTSMFFRKRKSRNNFQVACNRRLAVQVEDEV
jgi:hypothetical protein